MIKNKKIIFCIDTLGKGGAERVISVLSNEFCKYNDVYIITLFKEKIEYKINEKIKLIQLNNNSKNLFNYIKKIVQLKKIFKSIKPDVIISFLIKSSIFTAIAGKKYNLIISDRNDPNTEYKEKIHYFAMKNTYKNAKGFVFQTNDAKKYFEKIYKLSKYKVKIILNPVDRKFENVKICKDKKKEIISIGRLTPQKNFKLLIESFSRISEKIPEYKLNIYGNGEMYSELQAYIEDKGLTNRVFLKGICDNIQDVLSSTSIYVLSSNYEGMPNTLIEAMTVGLPVIATDCPCGGPKMLIQNKINGILVPKENSEIMSKEIMHLIKDEKLREKISIEARKIINKVKTEFIVKEWSNFILDIIS